MNDIRTDALAAFGERAARGIKVNGYIRGGVQAQRVKRELRRVLELGRGADAPAWYADNAYLARREAGRARSALREAGRLRRGPEGAAALSLFHRFLEAGELTEERLAAFLSGVRQTELLPENEAVLTGAMLRSAVLAALAAGCEEAEAARLFTALRTLAELDLTDALEQSDPVDAALRRDPVYPLMDEPTRAAYRRRCQTLARRRGTSAVQEAETAVQAGLHRCLFPNRERSGFLYIAVNVLVSLGLSVGAGLRSESWLTAVLLVTPLAELVRTILDASLLRFVPPKRLPRLALEDGVVPEGRTVCAVSVLLTDEADGPAHAARLEQFRLASRDCGDELLFALLADLPESKRWPPKGGVSAIDAAAKAISALNEKYGSGFFLLTRDAVWCESDRVWMPKERKRGAITELARLVCGKASALKCVAGDRRALRARYILTLDADTRLMPGAARQLIGAAMHPLNRPVVRDHVVVSGHGLIHPRMAVEMRCAMATDFARIHVGQGGTDPYGAPNGELFFDLFSRGGFSGKGVIDAQCYLDCLEGRIPDNRVLSHDALEGAYLRGAYMGDTELSDSAPVSAAKWFARMHRWTRGDWQNLPWLLRRGRELSPVDRWRLFDNLRRSQVSVFTLVALVLGFFSARYTFCAAVALGCLAVEALLEAWSRLFARPGDLRLRCRSGVLRGVGGALTRLLSRLVLLPWEAFTCEAACLAAVWRMTVSHRRLLCWVTAAQAEGRRGVSPGLVFSMALGAALLLFCPGALGKAVGLIWLATPLFTTASGWEHKPRSELTDGDRAFLRKSAAAIWGYFASFCTPEDGFLPPDNYQVQPPKGAARRTSPTNIGLALLSALAALDLRLCPPEEAFGILEGLLATVEALPKWRGHLYNWYDTAARAPLQPAYVSTVDSGNLCACLLCLKHGLGGYGRPDLAARAAALCDATELGALYDAKKRLFRIGVDPASGKPSPGHYDLLASEARLTSYLALARGEAPVKHWGALSRAQLSLDGWRGLASWSGSVFEYLMPELFLPLERGSLLWETARFCVYAQRRRAQRAGAPWGNSESAFFSLDAGMDYRYKANGAGALALRRDMDAELVVSPYSSFLALPVQPKAAVKNLRRLKGMGLWGRFGFYEAIDLTPGRSEPGGSVVRCFMVHHLGMSMAAIANSLLGGVMRRRFLAEASCAAFTPLLAERVPLGGSVLRRSRSALPRARHERQEAPAFSLESHAPDLAEPAWFPLSNGVYSVLASESGLAVARSGGVLLYRPDGFELRADGQLLTPSLHEGCGKGWRFAGGTLSFFGAEEETPAACSLAVAQGECGELRHVTAPSGARLTLRFEPVLARQEDYEAHPAFWRMGLECRIREGALTVRRLRRGSLPELWLCLRATVPLTLDAGAGWQMVEPLRLSAVLPEGGCAALALCFAATRSEAMAGARRILSGDSADMAGTMAGLLAMGTEGLRESLRLCTALAAPRVPANALSRRENLWKHGISGDLPLIYCDAKSGTEEAKRLIKRHALLTACGVGSELIVDTGEDGSYLHPRAAALRGFLDKYGLAPFENARGGVRFASDAALRSSAVLPAPERADPPCACAALRPLPARGGGVPAFRWQQSGAFGFDTPPLPPRAWQNVLSNGRFGYIATDCGTGHMWLENARECPVTPWENDPLAVRGSETLELWTEDGRHSLFADGLTGCRVSCGFGWTRWERAGLSLTAFIPGEYRARIFLIEGGEGGRLVWHIGLRLSGERADAPFVVTGAEDGCLTAENARRPAAGVFRALASRPFSAVTCDEASWLRGELDGRCGAGLRPCFGAAWPGGGLSALVCGFEERAVLEELADPSRAARELLKLRDGWRALLGRVRIRTPEPALNDMMNGWAAYQAMAGRILGRSSIYQSGGAYGFRDQLQDAANLLAVSPQTAREQLLRASARQFREGDVLHWWHEDVAGPRGVRTRCSDDLLWLPWALCEYTEKTGDTGLCSALAPWLAAEPLAPTETERYFAPPVSTEKSPVLEHAHRALLLTLTRGTGPHGLLRTGSGDWNDGMDRVGGESVWLTMFFIHVAERFAALLQRLGKPGGQDLREYARQLTVQTDRCWDGRWYLRGWWEDGAPLGAAGSDGCAIDSVAQSWAAFCPGLDQSRVRCALHSAYSRLYDEAHGLTKLFDPPFGDSGRDPGYIRACGPGFRENGGQYTHGALWLASALLREGMTEQGSKLLLDLLPARHPAALWATEPYVLAADVSANEDHYGEALWSWYSGSAGWFFRVVLEDLLGIRLENGRLRVTPRLPAGWTGYEADIGGRHITVRDGRAEIK